MRQGIRARPSSVIVVALAAALLAAPTPAFGAATRYAAPDGDGAITECSQADPCAIEPAIEHTSVNAGDQVVLLSGTYTVTSELLVDKAITVHGQVGQPPARLVGSVPTIVRVDNTGASVSDFEVEGSGAGGGAALVAVVAGVAERLFIHSTGMGAACGAFFDSTLRDTVCWATGGPYAFYVPAGGPAASSPRLRNLTAIGTSSGSRGLFISSGAGFDQTIDAKNVIARGVEYDVAADTDGSASTTAVINLDHSNYVTALASGAGASITPTGSGSNQTAPPLFVDGVAGNFHQLPGSETIDSGGSDPHLGSTDIDGGQRIVGSAPDIGADEFVPPLPEDGNGEDTTPPDTRIIRGPKDKTKAKKATFEFTSDESDSSFQCAVDGQALKIPCTSPYTVKVKKGKHSFQVRATDTAGNADSTPATDRWKVKRKRRNARTASRRP
jgi:hypothetical protein